MFVGNLKVETYFFRGNENLEGPSSSFVQPPSGKNFKNFLQRKMPTNRFIGLCFFLNFFFELVYCRQLFYFLIRNCVKLITAQIFIFIYSTLCYSMLFPFSKILNFVMLKSVTHLGAYKFQFLQLLKLPLPHNVKSK